MWLPKNSKNGKQNPQILYDQETNQTFKSRFLDSKIMEHETTKTEKLKELTFLGDVDESITVVPMDVSIVISRDLDLHIYVNRVTVLQLGS